MNSYFPVILKVLTNPYVIGTAIVIFLYIDFCIFVANYKKKPKKLKKKSTPKPAPVKPAEGEENGAKKENAEAETHEETAEA